MKKPVQLLKSASVPLLSLLVAAGLLLALPGAARAQDDPPGRVARLNFIQGAVSFQPSGSDDWLNADPNRPLTTGDNLWADENSRAELHIASTAIRLASLTGISFLNLDDRTAQIQLAMGKLEIHVRRLDAGTAFEIDTPNLAFTLTHKGQYTILTNEDGNSTTIIVRDGEGEATGGGESVDLRTGDQYTFRGTDQLTYDSGAAPGIDDFESWSQERDQHENQSQSARYVSRDLDGYYDLDDNGTWQNDPDYGAVWYPSGVVVGWVPYRTGHWAWISPWGWTWVGAEPWGFAPYHFGRWAFVGGNWGWVPGPRVIRPVYAPALVGFVGGGAMTVGVTFGAGFSGVAWYPLGPRDVWIPPYAASQRYVQNANITNSRAVDVARVTTIYENVYLNKTLGPAQMNHTYANRAEAVTVVTRQDFVNARPVAQAAIKLTSDQIAGARVIENSPVAPTQASYAAANAKAASGRPPATFTKRPVVTKINPPAPASHERVYTNDSPIFKQSNAPRANDKAAAQDRANTNPSPGRNEARTETGTQTQQHPSVKFTPPVKEKEETREVHTAPTPKEAAPPKEEHHAEQPAHKEAPAHEAPPPSPAHPPK